MNNNDNNGTITKEHYNAKEVPIPELPVRHHPGGADRRTLARMDLRTRNASITRAKEIAPTGVISFSQK